MRKLQALVLSEARPTPGTPPKMEWLSIASLVVDDRYQRAIERRGDANIRRIAAEFAWRKFSPVMVAPVGGGQYAIIDGQHRTTAALSLGYEKVPCYIVEAKPAEAAAIFAAVNGNVTSLSIIQVYRAAVAAGEAWATAIDRLGESAGVKVLTSNRAVTQMNPHETLAIAALRDSVSRHGAALVQLALKCLCASRKGAEPGLLNSKRIKAMVFMLSLHPGWMRDEAALLSAIAVQDFWLNDAMNIEAELTRKLGKGREDGEAWAKIVARVREYHERKFKPSMIAGILHLPHDEVRRAVAQIEAGQA